MKCAPCHWPANRVRGGALSAEVAYEEADEEKSLPGSLKAKQIYLEWPENREIESSQLSRPFEPINFAKRISLSVRQSVKLTVPSLPV